MRVGSLNSYNYIKISDQGNNVAKNSLLNGTKNKNILPSLLDSLYSSSYDDDLYFNYADLFKKSKQGLMHGNAKSSLAIDSLRIDPDRPIETPEIENIEMLSIPQNTINHAVYHSNRMNYSNMFLGGLGDELFNKFLSDKGIDLPENAEFNISVDGYGKVTVSGLEDDEITNKIQDAMSYDFSFIRSVLSMFEESKQTIENKAASGGMGMSNDQHWKMQINSDLLKNDRVSLTDLSIDSNGKIQGLLESLYNKIYGSRKDMSRIESDSLDFMRDKITNFLKKGLDNIPTYNVSLTYANKKISIN